MYTQRAEKWLCPILRTPHSQGRFSKSCNIHKAHIEILPKPCHRYSFSRKTVWIMKTSSKCQWY